MRIAESASHQIFERKWRRSYRHVCFSVEGILNPNAIDRSHPAREAAVLSLNKSAHLRELSGFGRANEVVSFSMRSRARIEQRLGAH